MGTVIRPEISVKNRYWLPKHRYYELYHFCLQYHSCPKVKIKRGRVQSVRNSPLLWISGVLSYRFKDKRLFGGLKQIIPSKAFEAYALPSWAVDHA